MRGWAWIGILGMTFVCGGATCARRDTGLVFPPPPPMLSDTPSLEEVTVALRRTDAVRQLATNSASVDVLTMPSLPTLSATMQVQRERDFRLRASLPVVMGAGLDLGSNRELFWFEVPEGIRRTLYYARHEEYREQLPRAVLPVDPSWLMEAIGLVDLDPELVVAGPVPREDGKLEIRSTVPMPRGDYQRVLYVANPGGFVTHQFLYEPGGRLVAVSEASNHRFYDTPGCALPHRIRFELMPADDPPLAMQIDIGGYLVNQLLSDDPGLFTMPTGAAKTEDLTRMGGPPGVASAPSHYSVRRPEAAPFRGLRHDPRLR